MATVLMGFSISAPLRNVCFGSSQERKLFPSHCAPDRLGNELAPLRGGSHLGPGCYDNHTVGTIVYELERKPESRKGYTLAARTAPRLLPTAQAVTPSPQHYQKDWTRPGPLLPSAAPFCSSAQRFQSWHALCDSHPGPGAYAHDTAQNRKVSWPMKFGSPDWNQVPSLEKRSLRTELLCDKEFQKRRNRIAYFSLFYS
ncbi:ciliary microtubule-associated protein 3 isoform X2 [Lepisosteus oculatus]|uniref:ciliary microtubule-associated protein 3 isoform X2 n=1 Tax=Lepisosteus oculatus TaxID=7918 RepID=UPI0037123211